MSIIGEITTIDRDADTVLGAILLGRGWRSIDHGRAWEWAPPLCGVGQTGAAPDLFAGGPCILIDEVAGHYIVEGPAEFDLPADALHYRTRREVLDRLERFEAWTFPRTAAEVDPEHAGPEPTAANPAG